MSRAKQRERRKIIALLAERFPHCFSIQVPRAPLKIGIHAEVLAALNGTVKPDQLQRALAKYTSVPGYLRSIVPGTSRWDLYGSSAGVVTHEEAAYAKAKMGKLCQQAIDPANREILISHAAITAAR